MAASEARFVIGDSVLDDGFEKFGLLDVDEFIDSQFNYALEGQEELSTSDFSKTQAVDSIMEMQISTQYASTTSTERPFDFSQCDTQTNLDVTILPWSELHAPTSTMCSRCRKIMDKDDLVSDQTGKIEIEGN